MSGKSAAKKILLAGAIGGAVLSIAITLLMDVMYADVLGGTWKDAIVNDLKNFFSMTIDKDSPIVLAALLAILAIMGLFGAFLGMIFGFFVYVFFNFLLKEDKS